MMKLDEFTKPIDQMSKEELENYMLELIQLIKEDFNEAADEYNRTRNQIVAQ